MSTSRCPPVPHAPLQSPPLPPPFALAHSFYSSCCRRHVRLVHAQGMWSMSHNLGGFLAPLIAGTAAAHYGWRAGMMAPGLAAAAISLLVFYLVRDKPQDAGFPPVEETSTAAMAVAAAAAASAKATKNSPGGVKPTSAASSAPSAASALSSVVRDWRLWCLALTYFFVYVVRQGVTSWFVFYLLREKGVPSAAGAAAIMSGLELGGLLGSWSSGMVSDGLVRRATAAANSSIAASNGGGRRTAVVGLVGQRIRVSHQSGIRGSRGDK